MRTQNSTDEDFLPRSDTYDDLYKSAVGYGMSNLLDAVSVCSRAIEEYRIATPSSEHSGQLQVGNQGRLWISRLKDVALNILVTWRLREVGARVVKPEVLAAIREDPQFSSFSELHHRIQNLEYWFYGLFKTVSVNPRENRQREIVKAYLIEASPFRLARFCATEDLESCEYCETYPLEWRNADALIGFSRYIRSKAIKSFLSDALECNRLKDLEQLIEVDYSPERPPALETLDKRVRALLRIQEVLVLETKRDEHLLQHWNSNVNRNKNFALWVSLSTPLLLILSAKVLEGVFLTSLPLEAILLSLVSATILIYGVSRAMLWYRLKKWELRVANACILEVARDEDALLSPWLQQPTTSYFASLLQEIGSNSPYDPVPLLRLLGPEVTQIGSTASFEYPVKAKTDSTGGQIG